MLQGDRYSLEIEVGPDARAHLTTQGATKIQSMDTNYAAQAQTIRLRENAYLEYLPEPVIPFRSSRFITDTRIERDPTATLLYSEILVPGRRYHHPDECFGFDVFSSAIRAFDPAGRETFCEKYILEPKARSIRQLGVMGEFDIYANVLLLTPKSHADEVLAQVGAGFSAGDDLAYGASRLPNDAGLVFKVLGNEVQPVKEKIREFWTTARRVVTGAVLPPPFLWR
jgi:urease accessory protein